MNNVVDWIYKHKWAILPASLNAIVEIAGRNVEGNIDPNLFHKENKQALQVLRGEPLEGTHSVSVRDGVAIIPLNGPIFPRANLFTTISGGVSVESLARDFNTVLESSEVDSIVFNIDSPGGEITGIGELSDMIFNARGDKPIIAYVYGMGASGAYWIGSAADEIILHDTSEVGSIGIVAAFTDDSARQEKKGVKNIEIVSSVSPNKRPDILTPAGQGQIQKVVDELGDIFVTAVARNRGANFRDVIDNFGEGGMLIGNTAVKNGSADKVSSLETVISELISTNQKSKGGFFMTTKLNEATVANLKAENPGLYKAVQDESQSEAKTANEAGLEAAKNEGYAAGVKAENERIKSVESLTSTETEEIISANKYNTDMTKEKVSVLIVEDQQAKAKGVAKDLTADAKEVGDKASEIDSSESSTDDQKVQTVSNIVAGGNSAQNRKE